MNRYSYDLGEDPDNSCILIPKYRAAGRVSPEGKRYSSRGIKPDEKNLVPVRSIITKNKNKEVVTPDCLGTTFKDLTPGTAIGPSFGTSLIEGVTQAALGLKHGGHERVLNTGNILYAPKAVKEVREDGKYLILDCVSGGELIYPRPENIIIPPKKAQKTGDIVCAAYNTSSPQIQLNSMLKLMRAIGGNGAKKYFEKDDVIMSECYAYEPGIITYKTDKQTGEIKVDIGGIRYTYNSRCIYFYPEGTKIEKYQRFCSGVIDIGKAVSRLGDNIRDMYILFRHQFYSLMDKDFLESGLGEHSIKEEFCEMLFISLLDVTYSEKTEKIKEVQFLGTNSSIMNSKSFYTMLSYGYASKVVSRALRGEATLKGDIMTDTILGLIIQNRLDD